MLKTTDRDNALGNVFVAEPPLIEPYPAKRDDPIFAAIKAHKRALDRRNKAIEEICATEERCKLEERDVWDRYQKASVAILTTGPTTVAGIIALMNYLALPECSGPGKSETILDGARFSSNQEVADAAELFPALTAQALSTITAASADNG